MRKDWIKMLTRCSVLYRPQRLPFVDIAWILLDLNVGEENSHEQTISILARDALFLSSWGENYVRWKITSLKDIKRTKWLFLVLFRSHNYFLFHSACLRAECECVLVKNRTEWQSFREGGRRTRVWERKYVGKLPPCCCWRPK